MRSTKALRPKIRKHLQGKQNIHPNYPQPQHQNQNPPPQTTINSKPQKPPTITTTHRPSPFDPTITQQLSSPSPPQALPSSLDIIPRCYSQNRTRHHRRQLPTPHSQRSKLEEHVEKMLSNQKMKEQMIFRQTGQKNVGNTNGNANIQENYRNVFISQFERYYNLSRELKGTANKTQKQATLSKYIAQKSPVMEEKEQQIVTQELTQIVNIIDLMFIPRSDRSNITKNQDLLNKPVLNLVLKIKHKLQEAYRQRALPTYRNMFQV